VLTLEEATPPDFGQCHVDSSALLSCSVLDGTGNFPAGRHAYCYTYIRWDWCYHFQNDHNGSNTESKDVHSLLRVEFFPSGIFFEEPPEWNLMPCVNKKIFSIRKVYIVAHFQAQSQFVHP
jgi:hypothetical protein